MLCKLISESKEKLAGKMAIKIIITKPTPFWPSFCPWKKLTKPQVVHNNIRIQIGGIFPGIGSLYIISFFTKRLKINIIKIATVNPAKGEINKAKPVSFALSQFTALPPTLSGKK